MDLIRGIQYLENGPGGRKPDQGNGKSVQNRARNNVANEKDAAAVANHSSTEYDPRLGRKIDTTA